MINPALFAHTDDSAFGGTGFLLLLLAAAVLGIVAFWRVFQKAKQPGWASIIPIYNLYILMKIIGRPGWWVILYFIPIVNIIVHIVVSLDFAKAFGKSDAFGIFGLWLFSIIGYMILGFGDAKYKGPAKR